jgi:hypothetical protein
VGVEIAIAQLTGAPRRYCLIGAAESDADKLRANTGFLRDNTSVKDLHARAPAAHRSEGRKVYRRYFWPLARSKCRDVAIKLAKARNKRLYPDSRDCQTFAIHRL